MLHVLLNRSPKHREFREEKYEPDFYADRYAQGR